MPSKPTAAIASSAWPMGARCQPRVSRDRKPSSTDMTGFHVAITLSQPLSCPRGTQKDAMNRNGKNSRKLD